MSTRKKAKKPFRPTNNGGSGRSGNRYWMYGTHACVAAMANAQRSITRILCTRNAADRLPQCAIQPEIVDAEQLNRLVGEDAVHQGVIAEVEPLEWFDWPEYVGDPKKPLLLLDQVTDPHNVGAILRSAAAFDVAAVLMPKDHAARETAVMAKAACGAVDMVPLIQVTNFATTMKELQDAGYWLVGLDGHTDKNLSDAKLGQDTALILGAEGKGLRRLTAENCDMLVKLPMGERMESLNVSNAAAIALYSLFCQK